MRKTVLVFTLVVLITGSIIGCNNSEENNPVGPSASSSSDIKGEYKGTVQRATRTNKRSLTINITSQEGSSWSGTWTAGDESGPVSGELKSSDPNLTYSGSTNGSCKSTFSGFGGISGNNITGSHQSEDCNGKFAEIMEASK